MTDGSGWLRIFLEGRKFEDEREHKYLERNIVQVMDSLTAIHKDMLVSLRQMAELVRFDKLPNDFELLLHKLITIRENKQAERDRFFSEIKEIEKFDKTLVWKAHSDTAEFARLVMEYFLQDGNYQHELGRTIAMLQTLFRRQNNLNAIIAQNSGVKHERETILNSLQSHRAKIQIAIDEYRTQYQIICKEFATLKQRYQL